MNWNAWGYGRASGLNNDKPEGKTTNGDIRFTQDDGYHLNDRRPRARYTIPGDVARAIKLRYLVPDRLWDWQVRRSLHW